MVRASIIVIVLCAIAGFAYFWFSGKPMTQCEILAPEADTAVPLQATADPVAPVDVSSSIDDTPPKHFVCGTGRRFARYQAERLENVQTGTGFVRITNEPVSATTDE